MTPARAWRFELEGTRHVVSYTPGIATDRPDTLICDGYLRSIEWRRDSTSRTRGRQGGGYRAEFDVAGHAAVLVWVVAAEQTEQPKQPLAEVVFRVVFRLVAAGLGSYSSDRSPRGDVSLTVDNHLIGERTRNPPLDNATHTLDRDSPSDRAWNALLIGGSAINGLVLVLVAPWALNAGWLPFESLPFLIFGVPAVATTIIARIVGVHGVGRLLLAYAVIFVVGLVVGFLALGLVV